MMHLKRNQATIRGQLKNAAQLPPGEEPKLRAQFELNQRVIENSVCPVCNINLVYIDKDSKDGFTKY